MRKLLAILLLAAAPFAHAQGSFPDKPVRLVVAFPPGGSTDVTARLLATKLSEAWRQPVVVENRPGASANLGTAYVAKSPADGHTLLLATTALSVSASLAAQLQYDAMRDLAPVTMVSTIPNVLLVHPEVPAKDVREFIAYARANPGKLNFAAPGATSGQRLTFEQVKQATGTDIVMVPYAGGAPALQAVLGGQVHAIVTNVVEAAPHVKAGKVRALAVTTAKRASMLPDVPTIAETVAPGVDTSVWQALFAPAGTPPAVVQKIARDVAAALALPDVKDRLAGMGMDLAPGSPESLGAFLRQDIATWQRVGKAANIQPE